MATPDRAHINPFLEGPLGPLFLRTAAPIIFIMLTNGAQTLIDAWFLGAYVGAEALAAVTLTFPLFMLMAALSTLVANGMASRLARSLGAGDIERARAVFTGAHGLALVICTLLMVSFAATGITLATRLANGSAQLAAMGHEYIAILIWCSPVMFVLSVNGDALRCEGKLALMTLATVLVSAANIALTYLFVAVLDYGVSGSAAGTVLAQFLALVIVIAYRGFGATRLRWSALRARDLAYSWREILALGAPQSLSFIGISLVSVAVILAVQGWGGEGYASTIAAYGIVTRLMSFAYMPMMGINMATQTIVGNNYGAGQWQRSDDAFKWGLVVAIVYAGAFEVVMIFSASWIGQLFVDDPRTIAELGRIMPIMVILYVVAGGMLVLSGYLQAIGEARAAIVLTVARTYVFTVPLVLILPVAFGEVGIWFAGPTAELLTVVLAAAMLWRGQRKRGLRWGLLRAPAER
ncbi:MATE family efflux transporter [Mesorhizobium sp. CAU 1741]|uniref:MATE family efflux transporter n=1 Tax=Mesorhizobium sp. CAU 1741 TaxID=3140366 RepID=UPI00325ADC13